LDRSLTYRRHLESLCKKLTSRVTLLRQLAGSGWGAGATTLLIVTLALLHSTSEYCTPVWCRSTHIRLIDPVIKDVLRIVTGCLRTTLADNLPILAGIQPAELCHRGATLSPTRRAMEPGHLLHSALTRPSSANARQIETPICTRRKQHLISSSDNNVRVAHWADNQWKVSGWATLRYSLLLSLTPASAFLEWLSQEQRGSDLTASAPVSVSAPACTNGVGLWPPLMPVSMPEKNKQPTMLSSNDQSIDHLMDCTP